MPSSRGEGAAQGRARLLPDDNFEPSERLFRRFSPENYSAGVLAPDAIPFPDFSVNREKYSQRPEDVLHPNYPGSGIAAFTVGDVPSSLPSKGGGADYEFKVKHRPTESNHAHSEVWCCRNGQHLKKKRSQTNIPPEVQFSFRMLLLKRVTIVRKPMG